MDYSIIQLFKEEKEQEQLKELINAMLYEWEGSFDFLTPKGEYVYYKKDGDLDNDGFNRYCKYIRSTKEGKDKCKACDIANAKIAKNKGKPYYYICHAGLLDIAIPIIEKENFYGTILFGQCFPDFQNGFLEDKYLNQIEENVKNTSEKLNLPLNELIKKRDLIKKVSKSNVIGITNTLIKGTNLLIKLAKEKQDILNEKNAFEQETKTLAKEISRLSINTFWDSLENFLLSINSVIGASVSGVFKFEKNVWKLKSVTKIQRNKIEINQEDIIFQYLKKNNQNITLINYNNFLRTKSTIIDNICLNADINLDKMLLIRFNLGIDSDGLLFILLNNDLDINNYLSIEKELSILTNLMPNISTTYQNYQLYKAKLTLTEDMIHQIISPISNILGNIELMNIKVDYYKIYYSYAEDLLLYIDEYLNKLTQSSTMAVNLVRNFSTDIIPSKEPIELEKVTSLKSIIIGCAMDYQAIAKYDNKKINLINQDNKKIYDFYTNIDLFKQVIKNIIDNAVKYADDNSNIDIIYIDTNKYLDIIISNYGVPIYEKDLDIIFERGKRTDAAIERAKGHGIGLYSSYKIIKKLGGTIIVKPSKYINEKSTFLSKFIIRIYKKGINNEKHFIY